MELCKADIIEDMSIFQSDVRPLRSIAAELKSALKDTDQFHIRYQPIIESKTGQVKMAEALIRWNSPVLGNVLPGRFIGIAIQNGLIRSLTRMVLRKVCADMATCDELITSVNVSVQDIIDPRFPSEVCEILSEFGIPHDQIILECTDSITPDVASPAAYTLSRFQDLGIAVAFHELETGFTTFGFLQIHGFTLLKVERVMIDEALQDATSRENLQDAVHECKTKGFKCLAFGIETEEQADFVEQMGFDFQQGFFHSQSLSLEELKAFPETAASTDAAIHA